MEEEEREAYEQSEEQEDGDDAEYEEEKWRKEFTCTFAHVAFKFTVIKQSYQNIL